jgi:hypothetical protein
MNRCVFEVAKLNIYKLKQEPNQNYFKELFLLFAVSFFRASKKDAAAIRAKKVTVTFYKIKKLNLCY